MVKIKKSIIVSSSSDRTKKNTKPGLLHPYLLGSPGSDAFMTGRKTRAL